MPTVTILNASAHSLPLASGSVHCITTSPPYFSLRRYSGEQDIDWPAVEYAPMPGLAPLTVPAMRASLGLEPTPEAYIGHMVLVFRELWRVLREDGCCWAILGDSYTSGNSGQRVRSGSGGVQNPHNKIFADGEYQPSSVANPGRPPIGNKPGDLMLIPHRLAFALQADGWTVRNDCVWAKVAPMPESVSGWRWDRHKVKIGPSEQNSTPTATGRKNHNVPGAHASAGTPNTSATWQDCPGCPTCAPNDGYVLRRGSWRHTRAHEVVLMLTKGMGYWANQEAVRETLAEASVNRLNQPTFHSQNGGAKDYGPDSNRSARKMLENLEQSRQGRNPRSVLTPKPESYSGAHYAVFPSSLIAPLIRATCPAKCCPVCGAGWAPVVEQDRHKDPTRHTGRAAVGNGDRQDGNWPRMITTTNVTNYRPTCTCAAGEPIPGTVLDPFAGSGTTLQVARELGLNAIGIDLSMEYLDQHAKPRGANRTPSTALAGLPLFEKE